jgi:hypothetical protein
MFGFKGMDDSHEGDIWVKGSSRARRGEVGVNEPNTDPHSSDLFGRTSSLQINASLWNKAVVDVRTQEMSGKPSRTRLVGVYSWWSLDSSCWACKPFQIEATCTVQ